MLKLLVATRSRFQREALKTIDWALLNQWKLSCGIKLKILTCFDKQSSLLLIYLLNLDAELARCRKF